MDGGTTTGTGAWVKNNEEHLLGANISLRRDLQTSWEEKDRLREENERLRAERDEANAQAEALGEARDRLREENEGLRKRVDELEDLPPKTWREEWNKQQDENERLRAELNDKRLARYEPAYVGDLEEENERLRKRVAALLEDRETLLDQDRTNELQRENERLRADVTEFRKMAYPPTVRLRRIEEAAKTWRNRSDARALGMKDPDGTVGDALEDLRAALADQPIGEEEA